MKGQPTFSREAMQSLYDAALYDEGGAFELLMRVGPPDAAADIAAAMAHELSEAAKMLVFGLWNEAQASTPMREKEARRLADACKRVLSIAGVADGGDLVPMFGNGGLFAAANLRGEPRGEAAVMNALHAVEGLRLDALKMLEIEGKRRRMKGPKAGRPEVRTLQRFVRDMSCLYERVWRKAPGISTGDKAEPCGPLMRLMVDVLQRMRERGVRVTASADSLRAIWRRIEDEDKMPETHLLRLAGALHEAAASPSQ